MALQSWTRPPNATTISSTSCRRFSTRYNEQEMFHELLVEWRGFPVGEATWEPYSVMAVDVPEMMAKFMESHEDIDAVREMQSL
jgi:hypothetical protein